VQTYEVDASLVDGGIQVAVGRVGHTPSPRRLGGAHFNAATIFNGFFYFEISREIG
jgi:hypothetical protein